MSRDMFILKKHFQWTGFLENEPVFGRVKFTLHEILKKIENFFQKKEMVQISVRLCYK
jgi:hypothetical protein